MLESIKEKYKVTRKIGSGGMAEIYLAYEKSNGKKVAIKVLHPNKIGSYADKKRFQYEIKLTAKVDSPFVIKIFDWNLKEKEQYIVMEYIEGETLKQNIQSKGRLTVDECVEFSKQLALGFYAIHNAKIVHRDIKSTNIIVDAHGQAKIIDFGIAINDESERLTRTDNIVGSPQYIAPELIEKELPSQRSDIYSLGILMYEMLTGNVPFNEKTPFETVKMHQTSVVPPVNKAFPNIPQALANVVIKATARDKTKRYSDMYQMFQDLETCLDNSRLYEEKLVLTETKRKTFVEMLVSKTALIAILSTLFIFIVLIIVLVAVLWV